MAGSDSPSPSPSESPSPSPTRAGGLTFRQPEPDPWEATAASSVPLEVGAGSPSLEAGASEPSLDASTDAPTSSRASSASPASRAVLREAIVQGVVIATTAAHGYLARDDVDRESGIWLATPAEAAGIGEPLAAIANRRGGIGAGGNPDVADALSALVAFGVYVSRQAGIWKANRDYRRQMGLTGAGSPQEAPEGVEVA